MKPKRIKALRPQVRKQADVERYSTDGCKIVWRFDLVDRDGQFAFAPSDPRFDAAEVLEKVIEYSRLTWAELKSATHDQGKSQHHFLEPQTLSREAWERVRAKHLEEEADAIFSFRLQNKLRIIGIRRGENFHAVWYDPEHNFCPSRKKHT